MEEQDYSAMFYDTYYVYTKRLGKGKTKSILEDMSEIIGVPHGKPGIDCLFINTYLAIKLGYEKMKISSRSSFYSKELISYDKKYKSTVTYTDAMKFIKSGNSAKCWVHHKGSNLLREDRYKGGYLVFEDWFVQQVSDIKTDCSLSDIEKLKVKSPEIKLKTKPAKCSKDDDRVEVTFKPDGVLLPVRKAIREYNDFIYSYDVVMERLTLDPRIYRIYLDDTSRYGRFHSEYQKLPSRKRRKITINSEDVVEIDVVSSHPSILLCREGIEPNSMNVYDYEGVNNKLREWCGDGAPCITRKIMKVFVLVALNCSDRSTAMHSTTKKVFEEWEYEGDKNACDLVLKAVEETIPIIAKSFYKGVGLNLMKEESEVVYQMIKYAIQESTPLLFVHDSFICKQKDYEKVNNQIQETFKSFFGFYPKIEVK